MDEWTGEGFVGSEEYKCSGGVLIFIALCEVGVNYGEDSNRGFGGGTART